MDPLLTRPVGPAGSSDLQELRAQVSLLVARVLGWFRFSVSGSAFGLSERLRALDGLGAQKPIVAS